MTDIKLGIDTNSFSLLQGKGSGCGVGWTLGPLGNFIAYHLPRFPVSESPASMSVSSPSISVFNHLWSYHQLKNTITLLTVFVIADLHFLVNTQSQIYKGSLLHVFRL